MDKLYNLLVSIQGRVVGPASQAIPILGGLGRLLAAFPKRVHFVLVLSVLAFGITFLETGSFYEGAETSAALLVVVAIMLIIYPVKPFANRMYASLFFIMTLCCFLLFHGLAQPDKAARALAELDRAHYIEPGNSKVYWVHVEEAQAFTCPKFSCGIQKNYSYRDQVTVFAVENGWARVSSQIAVHCENGKLKSISSGNSRCDSGNGVVNGTVALWLPITNIGLEEPFDYAIIVSASDDYRKYSTEFIRAAKRLVSEGRCSAEDLRLNGGWTRSVNLGRALYFTYCGGQMRSSTRFYLDPQTGSITSEDTGIR